MKRSVLAVLLLAGVCLADRAASPATPERLARADLAVLAKVVRIEDKAVELAHSPGVKEKSSFNVAVLEVKERLAGPAAAKTVKLAFQGGGKRDPLLNLVAGQERLFFLKRQQGTDYYRTSGWDAVEMPLEGHLAEARRAGKLLANPMGGLKSKDAVERAYAAGLLVARYRTRPMADAKLIKEEAIGAAESKLILEALAGGDWGPASYSQLAPRQTFLKLGLTEKDGWKVKDFAAFNDEAKKWLKANAGKHAIKRFVTGDTVEP